jgi:hypothetical protein
VAIAVASLNRMLELGRPEYDRLSIMSMRGADFARLLIRATKRAVARSFDGPVSLFE